MLSEVVREQLDSLTRWAALPVAVAGRTERVFELFTEDALCQPAVGAYPGLSQINANGLPFQWSFCFGKESERSLRFLCEAGQPGKSPGQRLKHSLALLHEATADLGIDYPAWLWECVLPLALPKAGDWPAHWRSALWFGVGASHKGVLIKPYINLNRGSPLERWRRLGWILKELGRFGALERLCALSGQVSADSWPVGLVVDLCANGRPGRIKVYFRSGTVAPDWLNRWYQASASANEAPFVRQLLDAFPYCGKAHYPDRAFVVSLEFHEAQDSLALKTDLAVTRWMPDDAAIVSGTRRQLKAIDADDAECVCALESLGAWPPCASALRHVRFVGLGHEPDGSRHVNVYVEPPLPALSAAKPARISPVRRTSDQEANAKAICSALDFILASRQQDHWVDYHLPVGSSDQWVTAYVLWQLSSLPQQLLSETTVGELELACDWLSHSRGAACGWSYNGHTDPDADSTSIAILALRAHGHDVPRLALDFLAQCRSINGGTGTYPAGSLPGGSWTLGIAEVSAVTIMATMALLDLENSVAAQDFLRRSRLADGTWPSYWWHTPLYATYAALSALTDVDDNRQSAILRTMLAQFQAVGAFETALLLLCCQKLHMPEFCSALAEQLVGQQQSSGGWLPSAYLRLTDTAIDAPSQVINSGTSYVDQQGVFTTATVVAALSQHYQSALYLPT